MQFPLGTRSFRIFGKVAEADHNHLSELLMSYMGMEPSAAIWLFDFGGLIFDGFAQLFAGFFYRG